MTNVRCNGSEASLFNCSWSEVTVTDSSLYNDNVGVKCFNETGKCVDIYIYIHVYLQFAEL